MRWWTGSNEFTKKIFLCMGPRRRRAETTLKSALSFACPTQRKKCVRQDSNLRPFGQRYSSIKTPEHCVLAALPESKDIRWLVLSARCCRIAETYHVRDSIHFQQYTYRFHLENISFKCAGESRFQSISISTLTFASPHLSSSNHQQRVRVKGSKSSHRVIFQFIKSFSVRFERRTSRFRVSLFAFSSSSSQNHND